MSRRLDRHVGAGPDREPEIRLRERGGVVHAVADHRDDLAGVLQPRDLCDLVLGIDLGDRHARSRPRAATRSAVSRASPVSSTGVSPSRFSSAIASALVGFTVSRTTSVARGGSVPRDGDRRRHRGRPRRRARPRSPRRRRRRRSGSRRPAGSSPTSRRAARGDRLGDRMLGRRLDRAGEAQDLGSRSRRSAARPRRAPSCPR